MKNLPPQFLPEEHWPILSQHLYDEHKLVLGCLPLAMIAHAVKRDHEAADAKHAEETTPAATPTPRTDAVQLHRIGRGPLWSEIVPASFARQLETELAEAKAELAAMKAENANGVDVVLKRENQMDSRANSIVKDILMNHLPRVREGLEKGYVDENQILVIYDHAVRSRILTEHPSGSEELLSDHQWQDMVPIKTALIRAYTAGHHRGHEDTVEGIFTIVHQTDTDSYFEGDVQAMISGGEFALPPAPKGGNEP